MQFSLMTEPQVGGSYHQLFAAARWAEASGMASFARSDHLYWMDGPGREATEAFATLGGLARDTRTIRLCLLVSPVTFRHPAIIAKAAATIDQMSGGRLDLGLGTGWMEREHDAFGLAFPPTAERFDRLAESFGYLEAAFSGEPFHGDHYRLDADVLPRPTGLRMVVGGSGAERTPRLAGRYADEFNHPMRPAAEIAPKLAVMRQAAVAAHRDPDAITVSVMGAVFAAPDRAALSELIRVQAAARSIPPEELEGRLASSGIPYGTPDQVAETLAELEAVGVSKLYIQWFDLADLAGLETIWAGLPR